MIRVKPPVVFGSCLACILLFTLLGCGSGGDGDDFIGAGVVSISTSPSRIDTGDRAQVTIQIRDTHPDGVALKIFFPRGLVYVTGSSYLYVDDANQRVTPAVNQEAPTGVFLVYYFTQRSFGDRNRGTLILELEGTGRVRGGTIGVDIDVDNPLINNNDEFDINSPQYEAESETGIEVEG